MNNAFTMDFSVKNWDFAPFHQIRAKHCHCEERQRQSNLHIHHYFLQLILASKKHKGEGL